MKVLPYFCIMILQLNPTISVHTPLGEGKAMFLIDVSEQLNSIWKVRLSNGTMRNFYDDDVLIYPNKMDGEEDLVLPTNWER